MPRPRRRFVPPGPEPALAQAQADTVVPPRADTTAQRGHRRPRATPRCRPSARSYHRREGRQYDHSARTAEAWSECGRVFAGPERAARVTTESRQGERTASCRFCGAPLRDTVVDLGMSPLCESYLRSDQTQRDGAVLPAPRLRLPAAAGSCSWSSTSAPSTSSPSTPTSRRSPTAGCSTPARTPMR